MKINMSSILGKLEKYMGTNDGKERRNKLVKSYIAGNAVIESLKNSIKGTPEEAGRCLKSCLLESIESSGMSSGVESALTSAVDMTEPVDVSHNDSLRYVITVGFFDDMSRPSLLPSKYDDIANLADLYNEGVDHWMKQVYGYWHGRHIGSTQRIEGKHFVEQAVQDFKGNYASDYDVLDIKVVDSIKI